MKADFVVFVGLDPGVHFFFWDQFPSFNSCQWVLPGENVLRKSWNYVRAPTNFDGQAFEGLIEVLEVYSSIVVTFIVPFFCFLTYFIQS